MIQGFYLIENDRHIFKEYFILVEERTSHLLGEIKAFKE